MCINFTVFTNRHLVKGKLDFELVNNFLIEEGKVVVVFRSTFIRILILNDSSVDTLFLYSFQCSVS